MFVGTLLYGLVNSVILALVALGFSLTFGISNIANFAYGALYVLAGFGSWVILNSLGMPPLVALPAMVLLTALVGGLIYRFILIRLRGMAISEVIATFGIGLAILEALRYFGFIGFEFSLPVFVDGSITIAGTSMDYQRAFIVILGAILTGALWLYTHFTKTGLAFRGIAQDEETAICYGIDSDRIATFAMSLGGGLCAIGALVILPLGTITVEAGYDVLLEALAVCIVGGLGSSVGVIVASFILGMSQTFTSMYLGAHWMMIVNLIAILMVLVIKPSGLFGKQKELEERI
ncbi:MAG: branched-chain amino acid ABC transporter permease [Pseudomonadota bacterium]